MQIIMKYTGVLLILCSAYCMAAVTMCVFVTLASSSSSSPRDSSDLHPVVLIPALTATQIQLKVDRAKPDHLWCPKHTDWFTAWLNKEMFLPFVSVCILMEHTISDHRNVLVTTFALTLITLLDCHQPHKVVISFPRCVHGSRSKFA